MNYVSLTFYRKPLFLFSDDYPFGTKWNAYIWKHIKLFDFDFFNKGLSIWFAVYASAQIALASRL